MGSCVSKFSKVMMLMGDEYLQEYSLANMGLNLAVGSTLFLLGQPSSVGVHSIQKRHQEFSFVDS